MSTGLMPVWAGRTMRLDPFRLPQAVSYAAHDEHGEVTFTINHRGVTVRRMLDLGLRLVVGGEEIIARDEE